jgi:hypothetical protein
MRKIAVSAADKRAKEAAEKKRRTEFTLDDVARGLFQSDGNGDGRGLSMEDCQFAASYILKTSLGLRTRMDGEVKIALGPKLGVLTLTYTEPKP